MPEELPELVISSKTQSAAVIAEKMAELGYETQDLIIETVSDAPAPPDPAPVEETPPPAEEKVPAGDAGGLSEQEVEELLTTPAEAGEKKKSGSQRLKEKLQAKDAENAELRAKLDALQAAPPASTPPPAAPAPAAAAPAVTTPVVEAPAPPTPEAEPVLKDPPKWSDFEDAEDQLAAFTLASSRYAVYEDNFTKDKAKREQERAEAPAKQAKAAADAEYAGVVQKFQERSAPVMERRPDFSEVVKAAPPPTPVLARIVMEQEDGPELALWLAEHPDELNHINAESKTEATSTVQQVTAAAAKVHQALGRFRYIMSLDPSTLAAETPPATPPQTQQPPQAPAAAPPAATPPPVKKSSPVAPVGSRGATSVKTLAQLTPEEIRNMPPDEYRRRTEKGERFN